MGDGEGAFVVGEGVGCSVVGVGANVIGIGGGDGCGEGSTVVGGLVDSTSLVGGDVIVISSKARCHSEE